MKRFSTYWPVGLSLVSLALAIYSFRIADRGRVYPEVRSVGQRLDTVFVSVRGKHIRIPNGEPHVFVFFTPACGACQLALTHMDGLAATRRLRAELVGVGRASHEEIERFAAQNCPHIPLVSDPNGLLFRRFHVNRVPSCLQVGADGRCIRIVEACFGLDGVLEQGLAEFIGLVE